MICIVNVSEHPTPVGWNTYEVRINRDVIARFQHCREESLMTCLHRAAKAVEAVKWETEVKALADAPPVWNADVP